MGLPIPIIDEYEAKQQWTHADGDDVFAAASYTPTLGLLFVRGFGKQSMTERMREALSTIMKGNQVSLYWDVFDMRGFDAGFRELSTSTMVQQRDRLRSIPVGVDSALVAMAAMASNVTLGGLVKVYRERSSFEEALRRDLAAAAVRKLKPR